MIIIFSLFIYYNYEVLMNISNEEKEKSKDVQLVD